ncbi:MAG: M23 family metallopeptidase [Pseudomonadota bacterium]
MPFFNRPLAVAFGLFLASACASSPDRQAGSAPKGGGGGRPLRLCEGSVSNRPATDRRGRIAITGEPLVIRGVTLGRAPADGCLSSGFGFRAYRPAGAGGRGGKLHRGVDIATRGAVPVRAAGRGRVVKAGWSRGYGRLVILDHGAGVQTYYAHLSAFAPNLTQGARIPVGTSLGATGRSGAATGVHLHYEVRVDGRAVDPLAS